MKKDIFEVLIDNLRGLYQQGDEYFISKDTVRDILSYSTNVDLGLDPDAWEKYLKELKEGKHPGTVIKKYPGTIIKLENDED